MASDLYETLGVARTATLPELKKAYRAHLRKHHPDRNPGDAVAAARTREINGAYEVLSDPDRRSAYDRYGAGESPTIDDFVIPDIGDLDVMGIVEMFLGDLGGKRRPPPAGPVLTVSHTVASTGGVEPYELDDMVECRACLGSGRQMSCTSCSGTGKRTYQQGIFTMNLPCLQCRCRSCGGKGRRGTGSRVVKIRVPPGTKDGQRLRLRGQCGDGTDMLVMVRVIA